MRQQHYRFAHQVLMDIVLRDPNGWFAAAEQQGSEILREPWSIAGQGLSPDDLVSGPGPELAVVSPAPGVSAVLITMPPPQAPTECHWVAVLRVPGADPRYFVAERGIEADGGAPRAYWAEWRAAPAGGLMRLRGADLPGVTPDAFLAAALAACSSSQGPSAPGPFSPGPMGPPGFRPLPPPKKSRTGLFVGGGCLLLFLLVLGFGGFLLYQEEGRGLHPPDTEVASVPVTPGVPFTIEFVWDGFGYAFNNVFLVIEGGKRAGGDFKVRSQLACGPGARAEAQILDLEGRSVYNLEQQGSDAFSAWIYLGDKYTRSSPRKLSCTGTVEPVTGSWSIARVVVTQRQRPSDFFAR